MGSQRPLTKHEVQSLLAACDGASGSALEEITVVRAAASTALARLLDRHGAPWSDLVAGATTMAGWDPDRSALLAAAAHPDRHPDPEAVLDALWDLVQQLNERRTL